MEILAFISSFTLTHFLLASLQTIEGEDPPPTCRPIGRMFPLRTANRWYILGTAQHPPVRIGGLDLVESDALRLARQAYDRGDMWEAKQLIEQVLAEPPSDDRLARTRLLAGEIYRYIGDAHEALVHLRSLIDHWHDYPASRPLLEAYAYHDMGLAYRQQRKYGEALRCAETAGRLWAEWGFRLGVIWSTLNQAWLLCLLDRSADARKLLEGIREQVDQADDAECQWGLRLGFAHVAISGGDAEEALRLAGTLIDQPDTVPVGMLAQAHVIAGRALLSMGDGQAAMVAAQTAQSVAMRCAEARVLNDAQALLRRIQLASSEGA